MSPGASLLAQRLLGACPLSRACPPGVLAGLLVAGTPSLSQLQRCASFSSEEDGKARPPPKTSVAPPKRRAQLEIEVDGDSLKTSRPLSAVNLYLKEAIPQLQKDDSYLLPKDAFKRATEQYKELGPSMRAPYEEKAARMKAAFKAASAHKVQETPEERKAKYMSPYSRFIKANFAAARGPSEKASETFGKLAKQWKLLSDEDKAKYK